MLGPWMLALLTVAYLGSLFALAAFVDRSPKDGVVRRFSRHPAVTTLSLGVYLTAWTFFAGPGFMATEGWRSISTQIGAILSCALMPVLWVPLGRLVKARQLSSLADLFAYRYQSRSAAGLLTALLLVSSLPYQALQLHAIVEMVAQLGGAGARGAIAATTTGVLVLFGVMYGVRHLTPRERHDGLVAAVAFESLVKLFAHLALSGFVLISVFGGMGGLDAWLAKHPEALAALNTPGRESSWAALMLTSAAGVFLMPRQWHMAFTEGDERGLRAASFGLPAYLLIPHMAVPLIRWGAQALGLSGPADFYSLELVRALGSPLFGAILFLGAFSAATAMIIVTTVALAGMVQNHLVLPFTGVAAGLGELYPRLRWVRRGLVAGVILLGYGVYLVTDNQSRLVDLGIVAFVAVAQVIPGLVGVLVWSRATARGVIAGLVTGTACWIVTPVIPILTGRGTLPIDVGTDIWTFSTVFSLGANGLAFVWGSLRREPTVAEQEAAEVCRRQIDPPAAGLVGLGSAAEFVTHLEPVLGATAATQEVDRALGDIDLDISEAHPERLWALRVQLERNLTGLFGPMIAHAIVEKQLAVDEDLGSMLSAQLDYVEKQVAAAELEGRERAVEQARRYLRDVLAELPLGVVTLGPAGDVAVWNHATARISGVTGEDAAGRKLGELPPPWGPALGDFMNGATAEGEVTIAQRTVFLRRAPIEGTELGGRVLLLEDRTEQREREARMAHQDRLASIGQLAAGVAHEMKNPLAAIRCVAENLQDDPVPELASQPIHDILEQTRRIESIVRSLRLFSEPGVHARGETASPRVERLRTRSLIDEALRLVRIDPATREREIAWRVDCADDVLILGDRHGLLQVLVNILKNVYDASSFGQEISIECSPDGDRARLRVCDHGRGIPADFLPRVFDPFVTTKPVGSGTGMGLSVAHGIVREHGGAIDIHSVEGEWTTVDVWLPSAPSGEGAYDADPVG